MKEQQINDLFLMYGCGYRGPVKAHQGGPEGWTDIQSGLELQVIIELELNGDKYKNVYIPERPFSDLWAKDDDGVCDAERVAISAYPAYFGSGATVSPGIGSVTISKEHKEDGIKFEFAIMENHKMYCIKRTKYGGYFPRSIGAEPYKFLYSKGYKVPNSLLKSES